MEPERAPLTWALELLTLADNAEPGTVFGPKFHLTAAYRIKGPWNPDVLQAALNDVVARHGALRSVVVRGDGAPYQLVWPSAEATLSVVDIENVEDFLAEVMAGDFPCDQPPLLTGILGHLGPDEAVLAVVVHHTACDAWSLHILSRDLVAAYAARAQGREPKLPTPMQYAEVAHDDHSEKSLAHIKNSAPFWKQTLAGVSKLGLPTEHSGPIGPKGRFGFEIPPDLHSGLIEASKQAQTTPFMMLLAAFVASMGQQQEVVVPIVTAGRTRQEWDTMGFLINALFVRVSLAGDPGLSDIVRRVHEACVEAYAHEMNLIRTLKAVPEILRVSTSREVVLPAFQLVQVPRLAPPPKVDGLPSIERIKLPATDELALPFPFLWTMHLEHGLSGYVTYDVNLFSEDYLAGATQRFLDVLRRMC